MAASESFIVVYHQGPAGPDLSERLAQLGYESGMTRLAPGRPQGKPFFRKSFDDVRDSVDSLLHEVIEHVVDLYRHLDMGELLPEVVVCWWPRPHQDGLIFRAAEIQQLAVLGGQVLVDTYNG